MRMLVLFIDVTIYGVPKTWKLFFLIWKKIEMASFQVIKQWTLYQFLYKKKYANTQKRYLSKLFQSHVSTPYLHLNYDPAKHELHICRSHTKLKPHQIRRKTNSDC